MKSLPFPPISRRFFRVWQRNLTVYRKSWKVSVVPPLLEPLLYIAAFGIGLSGLIGEVVYQGKSVLYIDFVIPALLATTIMYNSFFETSYNSFVRMYYQKTFDAMMATPLNMAEIITGEIAWSATKSLLSAGLMLPVISAFGLLSFPRSLWILPLAVLGGVAFGATGMFFTSLVRGIETFNLPVFLFITPMFLFSGTFFPLDQLPGWGQVIAMFLPLTHLVLLARAATLGMWNNILLFSFAYILAYTLILFPYALIRMERRLIK
ncbi:MAG: ABC transporter permease [Desulfuromonadaceae bacterium]|nr:ABC transporter permease [Desulfuromonadaceae bacterium]